MPGVTCFFHFISVKNLSHLPHISTSSLSCQLESKMASISPRRTQAKNVFQHPGLPDIPEGKRRTKAQINEDTQCAKEAQEAQEAAVKKGISRIAAVEAEMEAEQASQGANKAKGVKPHPKAVKPRPKAVKKLQSESAGDTTRKTTSCKVSGAKSRTGGDDMLDDGADDPMDVDTSLAAEPEVKPKKGKKTAPNTLLQEAITATRQKINQPDLISSQAHRNDKNGKPIASVIFLSIATMFLMLTESTLYFRDLTWGFRNKKASLTGKVSQWRNKQLDTRSRGSTAPVTSSGTSIINSATASSHPTDITFATTVSLAAGPPSTPLKAAEISKDVLLTDSDLSVDEDSDDDSQERQAALVKEGKGKAAMKVSYEAT